MFVNLGGSPKVEKHAEGEEITEDIQYSESTWGAGQLGKQPSFESRDPCSSEHRRKGENQSPQDCWIHLRCAFLLYQSVKQIICYGAAEERECRTSPDTLFIDVIGKILGMVGPRELQKFSLTLLIKKKGDVFRGLNTLVFLTF